MKRTTLLAGWLAGLLMLGNVGFTYADAPKPPAAQADRRGPIVKGEITAIDGDALTVQTEHRGALTVQITGRTRFRAKDDPNFTLADLKVGDVIAVQGRFTGENTLAAQLVLLVPPDMIDDAHGRVTAIDDDTITVEDKDGSAVDVLTSADTKFHVKGVEDATIDDVTVGMVLGAVGRFDAGGALRAKQVIAGPMPEPRKREGKGGPVQGGEVSSVSDGQIVIKYLDGSSLTVTTDKDTLFIQRGDAARGPAVGSLSDVKAGKRIVAMGTPSNDGSALAARVILIGREKP